MDAVCTAHKFIQRKRPVPPHIVAKLTRVELGSMLTEPREQILRTMRVVVCGNMLRSPAEFVEQLDRENPLDVPGNFAARVIMWYLAEWDPEDVREIVEMIARDTNTRGHTLTPRAKKIVTDMEIGTSHPLFNFIRTIVKLDINSALVFSYREEAPVANIITSEDLNAAVSVAVEYLIHSVFARGIFVDQAAPAYERAFGLFRTLLRKLAQS